MSILQVLELLSEIHSILEEYSVEEWEDAISTRQQSLREAARAGNDRSLIKELQEIKGLYGGMGSFSDLFVTDKAGDQIAASRVRSVNARLRKLRTDLFVSVGREIERLSEGDALT